MSQSSKHLNQIGISKNQFNRLFSELEKQIESDLNGIIEKKGGVPSKNITKEDKLSLNLTYIGHYPTFLNLVMRFHISASYQNKIYHKTMD